MEKLKTKGDIMKLILLLMFFSQIANGEIKEFEMVKGKLNIENKSGVVHIFGEPIEKIKIEYTKIHWNNQCVLDIENENDEVIVKVKKASTWSFGSNDCKVDFNIKTPLHTEVSLVSGSGNVSVNSTIGDIDFKVGSGNVSIQKVLQSNISGKAGSGNIGINGDLKNVDLKVGSGKISAEFDDIKSQSECNIKSGSGDVTISLPKKNSVSVNYKSGSGRLTNNFKTVDSPDLKLNVKSGSGNLTIVEI